MGTIGSLAWNLLPTIPGNGARDASGLAEIDLRVVP
jgi:hypothetical protein